MQKKLVKRQPPQILFIERCVQLLKENGIDKLNDIFETFFKTKNNLLKYMKNNKTECALKIFCTDKGIDFPDYILRAIKFYEQ